MESNLLQLNIELGVDLHNGGHKPDGYFRNIVKGKFSIFYSHSAWFIFYIRVRLDRKSDLWF